MLLFYCFNIVLILSGGKTISYFFDFCTISGKKLKNRRYHLLSPTCFVQSRTYYPGSGTSEVKSASFSLDFDFLRYWIEQLYKETQPAMRGLTIIPAI